MVYVLIGYVVGRHVKTKSDYFVAGRKAPTLLITGSLVASYMSAVGFTGDVGLSYDGYPILLLILLVVSYTGYILGPLIFGRYLRRSNVLTIPEFLGKRFDSRRVQVLAGVTVIAGVGIYLLAITQGLALLMSSLLDINFATALLVLLVAYTSLTIISGSPGVLVTDTIMFVVFTTAAIMCMGWVIWDLGGPQDVVARIANLGTHPDSLMPHGLTGSTAYMGTPGDAIVWAGIYGVVWAIIITVSPWQSSRYMMAKNEHASVRGGAWAAAAMLVFYIPLAFGSLALNLYDSSIQPSENAFIHAAQEIMPIGLGAVALCGIFAAGLSTASTFLSLVGFSVSHDINVNNQKKPSTSDSGTKGARLAILGVGASVFVVAYIAPPAILELAYFAGALFAASWGPVCLMAVHSSRITARGASASIASGFTTVVAMEIAEVATSLEIPIYLHPAIVGFAISFCAALAASSSKDASRRGTAFRKELMNTPSSEVDTVELKKTKATLVTLSVVSIASIGVLYYAYYRPVLSVLG
nr:sodium:solute symporter family protein [Haloechinothrix aidingensis]